MFKVKTIVASISLVTFLGVAYAKDPDITRLEREINARNSAIAELINTNDELAQSLRMLQGSIDELTGRIVALEAQNKVLASEIAALKASKDISSTSVNTPKDLANAAVNNASPNTAGNEVIVAPVTKPSNQATAATTTTQVPVASKSTDDTASQQAYNEAVALINQGSLKEALVLMSKFIEDYPNSSLIPNAYYWVGQINYHQKQYSQARENFLKVTKYKDSNKRAEAIYKLGQIAENLNDKTKALKFYQVVLKTYPGKTEALLAKQAIENLDKK